jgi:hypothetical protein
MAILRFRIYWEEDDSIYRDIIIRHKQTFADLHSTILKAYEFDNKFQATFFRSNDNWLQGREISLEKYVDKEYKAEPLIMSETALGTEIKDPNQKFIYVYDFTKQWTFNIELINVDKEEDKKIDYPKVVRSEGIGPSQYGTKGLIDKRLAEVEEKYDLNAAAMLEGFSEQDEDGEQAASEEEHGEEESGNEEF